MKKKLYLFLFFLGFGTTTIFAAPVPDTGITKCYNDTEEIPCPSEGEEFYGQDGNYSINTMSYTKLDEGGNDLPITATSWAMVRDNVTGLIWENKNSMDDIRDYDNPHDADNVYVWYDSNPETNGGVAGIPVEDRNTESFIEALNAANFGGYSDWRLPTIKELATIIDYNISYPGPTINTDYFLNTISAQYVSSSSCSDSKGFVWIYLLNAGAQGIHIKDTAPYWIRAVRSGLPDIGSSANLFTKGDGTVTDSSTGLMWQQETPSNLMTWKEALTYCENLNLAGYSDWRMPTIKELVSIVDYNSYNPAIDTTVFSFPSWYWPNSTSLWYWSNSTSSFQQNCAWAIYLYNGAISYYWKNLNDLSGNGCCVRAVRGGYSGTSGNSNMAIAQQPMSGPSGTNFVQWGTGFTPNSTATLHFRKPDGTEYPTTQQAIDGIGHFEINYTSAWDKPAGTYTWWAVDGVTGETSNAVTYQITQSSINGLEVQTINPQSDRSFFTKFFPSPDKEGLVSGGSQSDEIAADGESRLLLRIVADTPCVVTVSEKDRNPSQNGALSSIDNYTDNSKYYSSVNITVNQQHNNKYFGFAVYKVPENFTISAPDDEYKNKLTRPIKLKISSSDNDSIGTENITLRRPPIVISHGLWSSPDDEKKNFRLNLWAKFEDSGSENINDYILLNDCEQVNSQSFETGTIRTRANLIGFLEKLRKKGITVTQVDYFGHSMGGIWGRLIVQNYKDFLTYYKGYIHKLITLDTPHDGSYLADIASILISDDDDFLHYVDPVCLASKKFKHPLCDGAVIDLTTSGCKKYLKAISVPTHAITGDTPIDTACVLLEVSTWPIAGEARGIASILQAIEEYLKLIDPAYGCENWFNQLDISTHTDYIVDIKSQEGGLNVNQLTEFQHNHMTAFSSDVNNTFYDLLNESISDSNFANGFPASKDLRNTQKQLRSLKELRKRMALRNKITLGDIQFFNPTDETTVTPGQQINVELVLTGSLTLEHMLILAPGSDAIKLYSPPYTTTVTIPSDAYDDFTIFAFGLGADGNLYNTYITLPVSNDATLKSVEVTPQSIFMNLGQTIDISVRGTYSDGTVRNMLPKDGDISDSSTTTGGITFKSGDESILTVSETGTITAKSTGVGFVLVTLPSSAQVTVRIEIFESSTLVNGDLNGNSSVDVDDYYEVFEPSYEKCDGDEGFNPACDFDNDGCVTITDLYALYQYYLDYQSTVNQ